MQRVIGRVKVQHELFGRRLVSVQKQIHHQRVNRFGVRHNLLVPVLCRRLGSAQLHTVQGARPGQRMAAVALTHPRLPRHILALQRQRQDAVISKPVVVVEVLVTQSQTIYPLPNQSLHRMFDPTRLAVVRKTPRQTPYHIEHGVR